MMLKVVNGSDEEFLKKTVKLTTQAARNIIEYRAGADGRLGTQDDKVIGSLYELRSVPYVKDANLGRLDTYARTLLVDAGPACAAESDQACGPICGAGTHLCTNQCLPDTAVSSCGERCTPCEAPEHAVAQCLNASCEFTCETGFLKTGGRCTQLTQLAVGSDHACGLLPDASVVCWGANVRGQLGSGSPTFGGSPYPVLVRGLPAVQTLVAGGDHTCALTRDGLYCWGSNRRGELGTPSTGSWVNGPLSPTPVLVPLNKTIVGLAAGYDSTCAVVADRTVWCWGGNHWGQLGDGSTVDRMTPAPVDGLNNVASVSMGMVGACAIQFGGLLSCWGDGYLAGDGTGLQRPRPTAILADVAQVSIGFFHACAIQKSGGVRCWGSNFHGELGDGTTSPRYSPTPINVPGVMLEMTAGGYHTCGLLNTGRVSCWGMQWTGAVGNGSTSNDSQLTPVMVPNLTGVQAVRSGSSSTFVFKSDGSIVRWGLNRDWVLGPAQSGQICGSEACERLPGWLSW